MNIVKSVSLLPFGRGGGDEGLARPFNLNPVVRETNSRSDPSLGTFVTLVFVGVPRPLPNPLPKGEGFTCLCVNYVIAPRRRQLRYSRSTSVILNQHVPRLAQHGNQ